MFNFKVFAAELIGTFALTFIGASAGMAHAGLVGVALAHGFVVAVFVYIYGNVSGTHVNPAVTFGLALNGTVTWGQAVVYWIAQFLGAILAAFLVKTFFGDVAGGATVGSLTTSAPMMAMIVEAVLTFFLVNTVLHAAVAGKAGPFAGWAIGATLVFAILAGGSLTGASLNPARTFGPALFTNGLGSYWIYLTGPLLGAAVATGIFKFFSSSDKVAAPAPVVISTSKPVAKKAAARRK